MFDVILRGGEVIDGTGKKRFKSDVGIVDDRITAIEDLSSSESKSKNSSSKKSSTPISTDQYFWTPQSNIDFYMYSNYT